MKKKRINGHRSRLGTNGKPCPVKHNDRTFNVANAEHINSDDIDKNIYWRFDKAADIYTDNQPPSFDQYEHNYYVQNFSEQLKKHNEKQIAIRHKERIQTMEEFRRNRLRCPEEVIITIGNRNNRIDVELMQKFFEDFVAWHNKQYPNAQIIDGALHLDEPDASPHIHARQIWFTDNGEYKEICQEKALSAMGIMPPDLNKKVGRYNNAKMTYTAAIRAKMIDLAKSYNLEIEENPREKSKSGRKLDDYKAETKKFELELYKEQLECVVNHLDAEETKLFKLDEKNRGLEAKIKEKEEKLAELEQKNAELDALNQKITNKNLQLDAINEKLEQKKKEEHDLQSKIDKSKLSLEEINEASNKGKNELERINQELKQLQNQESDMIFEKTNIAAVLQEKISQTRTITVSEKEQIMNLFACYQLIQTEHEKKIKELKRKKEEADEIAEKNDAVYQENLRKSAELLQQEENINKKSRELKIKEKDFQQKVKDEVDNQTMELSNSIDNLNAENGRLKLENQKLNDTLTDKINELKNQTLQLEQNINKLSIIHSELDNAKKEIADLNKTNEDLNSYLLESNKIARFYYAEATETEEWNLFDLNMQEIKEEYYQALEQKEKEQRKNKSHGMDRY